MRVDADEINDERGSSGTCPPWPRSPRSILLRRRQRECVLAHLRPGDTDRSGQGAGYRRRDRRTSDDATGNELQQIGHGVPTGHRGPTGEDQGSGHRERPRSARRQPVRRGDARDHGDLIGHKQGGVSEGNRNGADSRSDGDGLVDDGLHRFFFALHVQPLRGGQRGRGRFRGYVVRGIQ